jgi:hypothetical protein
MLWPHTKTSIFFNKQQENAPARIAKRILKFLAGCDYLLPSKPKYQLLIEMENFTLTKHKVLI